MINAHSNDWKKNNNDKYAFTVVNMYIYIYYTSGRKKHSINASVCIIILIIIIISNQHVCSVLSPCHHCRCSAAVTTIVNGHILLLLCECVLTMRDLCLAYFFFCDFVFVIADDSPLHLRHSDTF